MFKLVINLKTAKALGKSSVDVVAHKRGCE